ncbi:MAG: flagellar hook-associated protein FlgK [Clostridiales bacterium]|nr:flagellar hook-associated protein FlgK [Clostridiales bacterium]
MRPTFLGFEASKSALFASQKALDITGHNLSNISSEGYTRQRAVQVAASAGSYNSRYSLNIVTYGGMGTRVNGIEQIRDTRLDQAFRNEYCNTGYFDQKSAMLSDIESVLQELDLGTDGNGFGLRSAIEKLYKSLEDFSYNASSESHANIVASSFASTAKLLNHMYISLENSAQEFKNDLKDSVNEVNLILAKIADLNKSIRNSMIANNYSDQFGPNELLDQRNLLIDKLALFGEVTVKETSGGMISVTLGGHTVVKDEECERINYLENKNGTVSLRWKSNGEEVCCNSGSLKAYVEVLNGRGTARRNSNESPERGYLFYMDKLNSFANMLADVANTTIPHEMDEFGNVLSYKKILVADLGEGKTSTTLPITAKNITISDELLKDSSYIIYDKNSNDNTYILSMLEQLMSDKHQFETVGDRFTGTFEDFIADYCGTLGTDVNYNAERLESSLNITNEIINTRDSVSGVSETEETVNMLTYSRAFQAASRMMTTMDDLLDVIINKMAI